MGTYTTNYNLFMPTVGETGWGTLVNTNFSTIDTTMKSLSNRITAVENEVNGALSCTSVTTSGKVAANGGITSTTGTFSGAVTGASFNGATITTSKFNGVVLKSSGTITVTAGNTAVGYIPLVSNNTYITNYGFLTLLPYVPNAKYSGSIKFISTEIANSSVKYWTGSSEAAQSLSMGAINDVVSLTFTNIPYLVVAGGSGIKYYTFTLS